MRTTREERRLAVLNVWDGYPLWSGASAWLTTAKVAERLPGIAYATVLHWLRECEADGLVEGMKGGGCVVWARTSAGRTAARGGERR